MTGIARRFPPALISADGNTIRAAKRVRGDLHWRRMADAANWLLAKGSSLIVGGPPGAGAIAPGSSKTLHYYIWPHEQNTVRLWCISLMSDEALTTADVVDGLTGTVECPSGSDPQAWAIPPGALTFQPLTFRFVEVVDTPSDTPAAITIDVNNDSSSANDLRIAGVCCYEIARSRLASFGAVGIVDENTCNTNQPIYADGSGELGIAATAFAAQSAMTQARRAKLFDFCNQVGFTPEGQLSFTGTSNVFPANPFVMARHLRSGENEREVAVAVRAATSDTGQVRLKSSVTNDTVTLSYSSPTPAWQTGVLTIATEDVPNLASNAGIRSGTRDQLIVETTNAVEGSTTLYGIAVAETN